MAIVKHIKTEMQITQLLSITFCLNMMKKPGKRL